MITVDILFKGNTCSEESKWRRPEFHIVFKTLALSSEAYNKQPSTAWTCVLHLKLGYFYQRSIS